MTPRPAAAAQALAAVGLFLLALAVRASPWRDVYAAGIVVPAGNDAYYHLRRILYTVFRGGALELDPYLAFPAGAKPIWPPLFDRLCAGALAPFVPPLSEGGQARLEALAMWIPPLLGAATVVVTFRLVRRHWGAAPAGIAGLLLCVLSGHFWYSQLGFLDHHAAVALLAAVLLSAGLSLHVRRDAAEPWRRWRPALGLGLASGLALSIWPGSVLHAGLVHAGLLGALLAERDRDAAARLAGLLAGAHAVAFAWLAPAGWSADWPQWSAYSPVVLSRFQPLLFGLAAATLGACVPLWRRGDDPSRLRRALILLAVASGLAGAMLLALPGLAESAGDAWRWLAKQESFQSRVSESQPLLYEGGAFTLRIALARLSGFVLLLPLAAAFVLWRERARPTFARSAATVGFALALFAVTLLQKRFFNSASIGLAILAGLCGAELWRLASGRRGAPWLRLALAALGLLCVLPTLEPYARHVRNTARALRGENPIVTGVFLQRTLVLETADWLRENTPETAGWLDPEGSPEYAVMAPWPLGHVIQYAARRPTLVDNFGDDLGEEPFLFVDRYYHLPEAPERVAAAAQRGVRYVVAQGGGVGLARPATEASLATALSERDGSGEGDLPAVVHHRLVFESGGLEPGREAPALLRVFERVAGAEVVGPAEPGAEVELRLGLTTNRGRVLHYTARTRADAAGRYRFRTPYANGMNGAVRGAALYRLRCGEEVRAVTVTEAQVREGVQLAGPRICAGSASRPGASIAPGPDHAIGTS